MAINLGTSFNRTSAEPIDQSQVLSKVEMLTMNDDLMPEKYFAVCKDDGKMYVYDKSATPIAGTGKFSLVDGKNYEAGDGITIEGERINVDDTVYARRSYVEGLPPSGRLIKVKKPIWGTSWAAKTLDYNATIDLAYKIEDFDALLFVGAWQQTNMVDIKQTCACEVPREAYSFDLSAFTSWDNTFLVNFSVKGKRNDQKYNNGYTVDWDYNNYNVVFKKEELTEPKPRTRLRCVSTKDNYAPGLIRIYGITYSPVMEDSIYVVDSGNDFAEIEQAVVDGKILVLHLRANGYCIPVLNFKENKRGGVTKSYEFYFVDDDGRIKAWYLNDQHETDLFDISKLDTELSITSTRAVENRVVSQALANKVDKKAYEYAIAKKANGYIERANLQNLNIFDECPLPSTVGQIMTWQANDSKTCFHTITQEDLDGINASTSQSKYHIVATSEDGTDYIDVDIVKSGDGVGYYIDARWNGELVESADGQLYKEVVHQIDSRLIPNVGGGGGAALPTGGTTGQVLAKKSDADGDTEWRDIGGSNIPTGYEPLTITMTDGNGVTHTYEVLGKEVTP